MEHGYANHLGYTDIDPYEILRVTAKTITIREMKAELKFKPEFVAGGFSAVCVNQGEQEWEITPDETAPIEKAYLRKDGYYWSRRGRHILSNRPVKYYDFNSR